MKNLVVKAERDYVIKIDVNWQDEVSQLIQGRSRVAIITSAGFSPDLKALL